MRASLEYFSLRNDLGRPFFGPPGIPADRMKALRDAFSKVMSDPTSGRCPQERAEPAAVSGDELEALVKELVQPPEVIQRMKTFLQN